MRAHQTCTWYIKHDPDPANLVYVLNAIVSSEISSRIYQAIETLPGQCREVTRMAYVHGLKNQEIADNLQISINSVRAHKQRAIQLLRDKLDKKDLLLMIIFEKKLNFL